MCLDMYRSILSLAKNDINGKTVVIRIDANVPIHDGKITDCMRLVEALPTIRYVLENGAKKVVLLSHFGRPKAQETEFSLAQIVPTFSEILRDEMRDVEDTSIEFYSDFDISKTASRVVMCENLRFNKGEEFGDENFAKQLAELGDIYINDAFSCSHRAHASISVVAKFAEIYAGLLMMKEIETIESILSGNGKIFGVVGGAKVSTKLSLLTNLISKMKTIAITGGMANTFLYALGYNIGKSICEKGLKDEVITILESAKKEGCKILLPQNVVVSHEFKQFAKCRIANISDIKDDDIILDAGPDFVNEIADELIGHDIFVWNGPLGAFEIRPFNVATESLARIIAQKTQSGKIKSIIGGGDTASAVNESGLSDEMTHISTGGGAFLEWLEGKELPGISVVRNI